MHSRNAVATFIAVASLLCVVLGLLSCDVLPKQKSDAKSEQETAVKTAVTPATEANSRERFIFPTRTEPFPPAAVALDTSSGRLCKTYSWPDTDKLPKGLLLCSDLTTVGSETGSTGATKAYRGFTYTFDGAKWNKGQRASRYNPATKKLEPWNDDQYDPLGLFTKEEKSKHHLSEADIRKTASQFGVTYGEAWADAKEQGYQVPPK